MQTIPELNSGTQAMDRCDSGKKVIINSVGGALVAAEAVVVQGPYKLVYRAHTKKGATKGRDGKIHSKEITVVTEPYWLVRLNANGFYIHVAENELRFV